MSRFGKSVLAKTANLNPLPVHLISKDINRPFGHLLSTMIHLGKWIQLHEIILLVSCKFSMVIRVIGMVFSYSEY